MSIGALVSINLIMLIACVVQVSKRVHGLPRRPIHRIVGIFSALTLFLFFGAFYINGPGLEAMLYIYIAAGDLLLFWVLSLAMLLAKLVDDKKGQKFFTDLGIVTLAFLTIIPILAWLSAQGSGKFWG